MIYRRRFRYYGLIRIKRHVNHPSGRVVKNYRSERRSLDVDPPNAPHRYITSPAIPLISCSLFPLPPNPPGITIGNIGGGPIGGGDSLGDTDEGENTGGGDCDSCCM